MDLDDINAIENADSLVRYKEINEILSGRLIELAVEIDNSSIYSDNNFLNTKIIERYKGVHNTLFSSVIVDENNSISNNNLNISRLMLSWIALGSALESSIQLFLISYRYDYENNPFAKWVNFEDELVKEKIDLCLQEIRDEEIITGKQKRRLKKVFHDYIQTKKSGFDIEKISLYDLINYFISEVFSEDSLNDLTGYQGDFLNDINLKEDLHNIRKNRNVVHVFTNDSLDDWESFEKHIKIYYIVLLFLINRMSILKAEIEDMESMNDNLMQQYDFR